MTSATQGSSFRWHTGKCTNIFNYLYILRSYFRKQATFIQSALTSVLPNSPCFYPELGNERLKTWDDERELIWFIISALEYTSTASQLECCSCHSEFILKKNSIECW